MVRLLCVTTICAALLVTLCGGANAERRLTPEEAAQVTKHVLRIAAELPVHRVGEPARGPAATPIVIPDDHPHLEALVRLGVVRRSPNRDWGVEHATGEPDTKGAGDITTAWASSTPDGQREWLELTYEKPIKPAEVHVVETFNPGALFKVTAQTASGMEVVLWKGRDPTPRDIADGRGTSIVKVDAAIKTNTIRVHLASDEVPGWNEIDAVGIKDEGGDMHWAVAAKASSEYATAPPPGWVLNDAAALKAIVELQTRIQQLEKEVRSLKAAP